MANNSQEALNELRAFQGSRRNSTDILREQETALGVPSAQQRQAGLRAAITNTENLLRAVEPSVAGRTSGVNVTEAQKTRLVGLERQPLDEAFREQSRAFEGETANINELQRRALQQSQLQLSQDDQRESSLQGIYGTLYQREQDAVAKAERDRAFQEELRRQRAAETASAGWANLLGGGAASTGAPVKLSPQDVAYQSVQKFVSQGRARAESDYRATKASADRGNAVDKMKIELYHQLGIRPGGQPSKPAATGPSYNILTNQGAQNASNAIRSQAGKAAGWVGDRLRSNLSIFGI